MILGQRQITLRRRAAGSRNTYGEWEPGAAADSTILASVQPVDGKTLERLPEGRRQMDARRGDRRDQEGGDGPDGGSGGGEPPRGDASSDGPPRDDASSDGGPT